MNRCILLQFCILGTIVTTNYNMDSQKKIWLKTNDKKLIFITPRESRHSFLIDTCRTYYKMGHSKKFPIQVQLTKKQIALFKKIIHQPALYGNLPEDKFFKALFIAQELRAPFLYSALLQARLPSRICSLIIKKYVCNNTIFAKMHNEFSRKTSCNGYFNTLKQWDTATQTALYYATYALTLPQAVMLMSIKKPTHRKNFIVLSPHMPGFDDFILWEEEQRQFLIENLPIKVVIKENTDEYRPLFITFYV